MPCGSRVGSAIHRNGVAEICHFTEDARPEFIILQTTPLSLRANNPIQRLNKEPTLDAMLPHSTRRSGARVLTLQRRAVYSLLSGLDVSKRKNQQICMSSRILLKGERSSRGLSKMSMGQDVPCCIRQLLPVQLQNTSDNRLCRTMEGPQKMTKVSTSTTHAGIRQLSSTE